MTVLRDKMVTARKAHRCNSCSQPIAPGERYRSYTSADLGELRSDCWCYLCDELAHALFVAGIEGEDEYGSACYPILCKVDLSQVEHEGLRKRLATWQWSYTSYLRRLEKAAR